MWASAQLGTTRNGIRISHSYPLRNTLVGFWLMGAPPVFSCTSHSPRRMAKPRRKEWKVLSSLAWP
jgi:hypothetical protein